VDQPGDYPEGDTLVDMEASGFYPVASRFSTRELVQCVKIVSDNAKNTWRDLKKEAVEDFVRDQMNEIAAGSNELLALSGDEMKRRADPLGYGDMLSAWHFTETEKHLLRGILRRRQVLVSGSDTPVSLCRMNEVKSGAEALCALREDLVQSGVEIM